MRKPWAQRLALFTGVLLVLLAVAFAVVQNPTRDQPSDLPIAVPENEPNSIQTALVSEGRQIYDDQGCARCHSIAGQGSPRSPLDGVGERRNTEDIRKWIIAAPELKDLLAPRVFQAKQGFQKLPSNQLDALVAYLSGI